MISLLTVSAAWDAELDVQLRAAKLTTRKYGLLAHLEATPGISFSELARRSRITVQSAHTAVGALVHAGFVVDECAHAGAPSDLRVTDDGARALRDADARLAALDAAFAADAPTLAAALEGLHEKLFERSGSAG